MFNRTVTVNPPAVRIDVKQQPNDAADAARLYGELHDKAQAEVAKAEILRLGCNIQVLAIKVGHERLFETDQHRVRLLYSINGVPIDVETHTNAGIVKEVIGSILDDLTGQIVSHLTAQMQRGPYPPHTTQALNTGFDDDEG